MKLTKDEKLMLIVALGESSMEIEEMLSISDAELYGVFIRLLEGKFKLTNPQIEAIVKLLEYPTFRDMTIEALSRNTLDYSSSKYPEEDFEALSLKYIELSSIYGSVLTKLKQELKQV